ncbi:hypothetical protein TNCV_299161 [Trichonephila clavipes]|nr:hypothetical protein TNCV_299161 [Trichonephila clavipes]
MVMHDGSDGLAHDPHQRSYAHVEKRAAILIWYLRLHGQIFYRDTKHQEPWETLATVGPILRKMETAEVVARSYAKLPDMTSWDYTSTGLVWLLTRPAYTMGVSECMTSTFSDALDMV